MRVIFLDIDGVLNSHRSAIAYCSVLMRKLDPVAVSMLYRIVKYAPADLVISSTWRMDRDYLPLVWGCLREAGFPWDGDKCPIIGKTTTEHKGITDDDEYPGINTGRGDQIKQWLDENPEYDDYIILDDDSDMRPDQLDRFINIDGKVGLGYNDFRKIGELWPEIESAEAVNGTRAMWK